MWIGVVSNSDIKFKLFPLILNGRAPSPPSPPKRNSESVFMIRVYVYPLLSLLRALAFAPAQALAPAPAASLALAVAPALPPAFALALAPGFAPTPALALAFALAPALAMDRPNANSVFEEQG